jgi:hypothetical protein
LIDAAASRLRHDATRDGLAAGLRDRERTCSLAALLSTIALHLADLPDAVRADVLNTAGAVLGKRGEQGTTSVRVWLT